MHIQSSLSRQTGTGFITGVFAFKFLDCFGMQGKDPSLMVHQLDIHSAICSQLGFDPFRLTFGEACHAAVVGVVHEIFCGSKEGNNIISIWLGCGQYSRCVLG